MKTRPTYARSVRNFYRLAKLLDRLTPAAAYARAKELAARYAVPPANGGNTAASA